jgi:tRNA-dihydrouridine synthase
VSIRERGQFLLDYIQMLLDERVNEAAGFRHVAPGAVSEAEDDTRPARGHERWVINKLRALCSWYSKGLDGGSQLRVRVNSAERVSQLREIVDEYFMDETEKVPEVV